HDIEDFRRLEIPRDGVGKKECEHRVKKNQKKKTLIIYWAHLELRFVG
ncbi:37661_t:CDS:1, partial [Gigaspora margarita]